MNGPHVSSPPPSYALTCFTFSVQMQSATYLNETGKSGTYSARDRLNRYKKRQKGGDGDDEDGVRRQHHRFTSLKVCGGGKCFLMKGLTSIHTRSPPPALRPTHLTPLTPFASAPLLPLF
jgi:hypothetical protein